MSSVPTIAARTCARPTCSSCISAAIPYPPSPRSSIWRRCARNTAASSSCLVRPIAATCRSTRTSPRKTACLISCMPALTNPRPCPPAYAPRPRPSVAIRRGRRLATTRPAARHRPLSDCQRPVNEVFTADAIILAARRRYLLDQAHSPAFEKVATCLTLFALPHWRAPPSLPPRSCRPRSSPPARSRPTTAPTTSARTSMCRRSARPGQRADLTQGASIVSGDFDEVAVGIAEIDRHHRPERALALDRAELDGDAAGLDVAAHLGDGRLGDQAEIAGADRDMRRLRLELAAFDVDVDFLPAEADRSRALAVRGGRHHAGAQHALIEAEGRLEVAHGEHDVVEAIDAEAAAHSAGAGAGSAAAPALSRGRNKAAATMIAAKAASAAKSQVKSPVRSKMKATRGSPSALTPKDSRNFAPNAVARQRPGV